MPIIRPYQPSDETSIIRLFSIVFQHELPLPVWQWKYLRDGNPPPVFVAEEDGQIVCHFAALRQRLIWHRTEGIGWDSVDTMCHPRYQGRGLFRRTVQEFMSQFGEGKSWLMYGFPGERHRRLGELLVGYEPVAPVYKVRKAVAPGPSSLPEGVVLLETLLPDWDVYWHRLEERFGLVARRDRVGLTWRYLTRPGKRYRLLTVPGIPALAVVGIEQGKAYLMEFLLPEEEAPLAQLLLFAVEAVCRAEGAGEIEGWFARFAWECTFLTGPGDFAGAEADNYFECRIFDRRLHASWLAENFYYSLGDYDVF